MADEKKDNDFDVWEDIIEQYQPNEPCDEMIALRRDILNKYSLLKDKYKRVKNSYLQMRDIINNTGNVVTSEMVRQYNILEFEKKKLLKIYRAIKKIFNHQEVYLGSVIDSTDLGYNVIDIVDSVILYRYIIQDINRELGIQ